MPKTTMTYSHSRLETFESCRLKFKYKYIEKVDVPKRNSIEAFLGSRVHETLEALYKGIINGKVLPKEEFLKIFADLWEKEKSDGLYIVNKQYTLEDYFRQGHHALSNYWDRYYPFNGEKTIALEKRIEVYLDDGKEYKLQGFIDRISKSDSGVWQIRDYKTKRTLPTLQEAHVDRQLALYQIGLQSMWDNTDKVELIWHYLLFDEEIKSTRERSDLERLKIETIHLIHEVEQAVKDDDFPYTESALCDWCDYFDICPAKKHLAEVRSLPPKEFKRNDGVQLVDNYSRLLDEKARINLQLMEVQTAIDKLAEEIYEFARQFRADMIYGSDLRLRVSMRETYHAPSREDKAESTLRDQLEDLLKRSKIWDQVSQLNTQRLVKMYQDGTLPQYIRDQLQKFLTPVTRPRIYANKPKDYDDNFVG